MHGSMKGPSAMASVVFETVTLNCVRHGFRDKSYGESQYFDNISTIYGLKKNFKNTWQCQGLETGILHPVLEGGWVPVSSLLAALTSPETVYREFL